MTVHVPASPFAGFAASVKRQTPLRAAVTAACRRPEPESVAALLDAATLPPAAAAEAAATARGLVERLRAAAQPGGVEGLIREYDLSSQEGVALMCLAEALLRIPDAATRDALIRDKIAGGDWRAHLGRSASPFVNAATWGLVVTGRLTGAGTEATLGAALTRLLARGGEPVIRRGVDLAMRMMGERFVTGQTIAEALANSRALEARGFRHSYDMLGEAAATAADAARYLADYEGAIRAIGAASGGRGPVAGPGISVKLSALHPRYSRAKLGRVLGELLPRVKGLAALARARDIGFNIDAEESERLEISLDVLEALALDPDLAGWDGLGFVVQAYGRRCPAAIDWVVDLARRVGRRIMVRLVKGAYWDAEIKRAQADGLADFPVFTRKLHTDVSYLACARRLLDAPDAVFPQFATHNAQTVGAILAMAGPGFRPGDYEFQCLHGMGEPLYGEVVGADKLDRPCRIYAPVGTHETLLAYLVRRLLENGANSSFVNRIADAAVPVEALVADPVAQARAEARIGAPHPRIAAPRELFPGRANARGLDLADDDALAALGAALELSAGTRWTALPAGAPDEAGAEPVLNPADRRDAVGLARAATPEEVSAAAARAAAAAPAWAAAAPEHRAARLRAAADGFEARMPALVGLLVREAGKSYSNAVAEVREAVDFLRYYAGEAVRVAGTPLGPVACVSPWNFPLAIFAGQAAAALAAGNPVLAKPAGETPLVAAEAVRLLHAAGVPDDALQLLPGGGEVGAALVGDPRVMGVTFTGSTAVARLIARGLAGRLTPDGRPVPLVAETGGLNCMVVDSSALAEQVVADVVASAFDSAGQRCSALRVLCLQDEAADRILALLKGALAELEVGDPRALSADVGPVITAEARDGILAHVAEMRARGHAVHGLPLPEAARHGTFVAPTIVEVSSVADVGREVFGPVLHVLRYRRADLDALLDAIDATGYGLTFGLHTRIDDTVARVVGRVAAGNVYVNRNIIGAVVGSQPFGGAGLSGTGPKAGGPLYLRRLTRGAPAAEAGGAPEPAPARAYADWLGAAGHGAAAERCRAALSGSPLGAPVDLPGPVGERNTYALRPRGRVAALAAGPGGLRAQVGVLLATGNVAVVERRAASALDGAPADAMSRVLAVDDWAGVEGLRGVVYEGGTDGLRALSRVLAERDGPILMLEAVGSAEREDYPLWRLCEEVSVSTNTAAAGGNASLMAMG